MMEQCLLLGAKATVARGQLARIGRDKRVGIKPSQWRHYRKGVLDMDRSLLLQCSGLCGAAFCKLSPDHARIVTAHS